VWVNLRGDENAYTLEATLNGVMAKILASVVRTPGQQEAAYFARTLQKNEHFFSSFRVTKHFQNRNRTG